MLSLLLGGEIANQEDYDKATLFLLGSGTHAAGSLMLSIIDEHGGQEAIMAVVLDPRSLLVEYNKAAAASSSKSTLHASTPRRRWRSRESVAETRLSASEQTSPTGGR